MKIATEHIAIEAAFDAYRKQLDLIPDDLFDVTPPGGGWSYAEVYAHILKATLGASVALEKCTQTSCPATTKKPNLFGRLLLLLGVFPPVKMPQGLADKLPVDKITKEDARNLLIKCRRRVDIIIPLAHDSVNDRRTAHPRLGMLNARQWLKFIRIHLTHHLKQLRRIENKFGG